MRKYIVKVVIVMGLISMIMGFFTGCSQLKSNILPENVVDRLWVSADGRYQMKVEEDEVIFYTDGYDRVLISSFSTESRGEDKDIYTEFKLRDNRLKKEGNCVFAAIEKLNFKDGAFSVKIVYSESDGEWVTLNETYKAVFNSYKGGGPEYSVKIFNEDVLQYYSRTLYPDTHGKKGTGSGFDVIFYFGGCSPGTADVYIISNFLGEESIKDAFSLVVDENYHITKSTEKSPKLDVVGEDRFAKNNGGSYVRYGGYTYFRKYSEENFEENGLWDQFYPIVGSKSAMVRMDSNGGIKELFKDEDYSKIFIYEDYWGKDRFLLSREPDEEDYIGPEIYSVLLDGSDIQKHGHGSPYAVDNHTNIAIATTHGGGISKVDLNIDKYTPLIDGYAAPIHYDQTEGVLYYTDFSSSAEEFYKLDVETEEKTPLLVETEIPFDGRTPFPADGSKYGENYMGDYYIIDEELNKVEVLTNEELEELGYDHSVYHDEEHFFMIKDFEYVDGDIFFTMITGFRNEEADID